MAQALRSNARDAVGLAFHASLAAPYNLAARLALANGPAVFLGLAFEEVYKSEQREIPGGIRSFPTLAMAGAMLMLIEPSYALGVGAAAIYVVGP